MELFKKNISDPQLKYSSEMDVDTESRTASGYFSKFWNVDEAGDMVLPSAFDRSIQDRGVESGAKNKILLHWMHDMSNPIGSLKALSVNKENAYFEAYISKIPEGDRAIEQYKDGTLNQHSFGYYYTASCKYMPVAEIIETYPEMPQWAKDEAITKFGLETEIFVCPELKLIEISVVSYGCNSDTEFTGLKSLTVGDVKMKIYEEIKTLPQSNQYQIKNLIKTLEQRNNDLSEKFKRLTNPVKEVTIEELISNEVSKQFNL